MSQVGTRGLGLYLLYQSVPAAQEGRSVLGEAALVSEAVSAGGRQVRAVYQQHSQQLGREFLYF